MTTIEQINIPENKYWVHYDEDSMSYWIGTVVNNQFVQQVGDNIQYKAVAIRKASRFNLIERKQRELA